MRLRKTLTREGLDAAGVLAAALVEPTIAHTVQLPRLIRL